MARGSSAQRFLTLGKYEILTRLGSGGMAAVYKARDSETGQLVAIKVLPPDTADNPVLLQRFEREARTAARLNHENIVAVYELGEANHIHYIAMEYVPGIDLDRYINAKGRVAVDETLEVLTQAARALDHAHQFGVVHRDIKPSNFLLTKVDGRLVVKLADLGLALDRLQPGESRLTKANSTLGTVDYMAPEQARGGHYADIRSDLYALGCTAYHMLTGQPPFPDGSIGEKLYKQVHVMPTDPRELNPTIPDEVLAILGRLLQKDPAERYQTPAELLRELERLTHLTSRQPTDILAALADGAVVRDDPPAHPAVAEIALPPPLAILAPPLATPAPSRPRSRPAATPPRWPIGEMVLDGIAILAERPALAVGLAGGLIVFVLFVLFLL